MNSEDGLIMGLFEMDDLWCEGCFVDLDLVLLLRLVAERGLSVVSAGACLVCFDCVDV